MKFFSIIKTAALSLTAIAATNMTGNVEAIAEPGLIYTRNGAYERTCTAELEQRIYNYSQFSSLGLPHATVAIANMTLDDYYQIFQSGLLSDINDGIVCTTVLDSIIRTNATNYLTSN